MVTTVTRTACFALSMLLACLPCASSPRSSHSHDKTVWNYEGGIWLVTDGSIANGPCFRISGHVTAPHFFDNLKRIDDEEKGAIFLRGTETVKTFPDQLLLSFMILDRPCSAQYLHTSSQTYLTRALVSSLRLNLYWKHGVDMRPIKNVVGENFTVKQVQPYAADLAKDLPEKFEWFCQFAVPSADVPLSDSLVLIIRTPDDRIAARVAARM